MDRKDAQKVIENLQNKPFICGEDIIEVEAGYVILKKEEYKKMKGGKAKMSDLISREALMQILNSKATKNEVRELSTTYTLKELAYIIYTLPAVYDVDKVVEQLEELRDRGNKTGILHFGDIIETVKAGGANE